MPRFNHDLLRTVRLDLGMTQEQAAAALGVDVRTYRRYESGAVNRGGAFTVRSAARRKLLARMCKEFGVDEARAWLTDDAAPVAPAPLGRGWTAHLAHPLQPAQHFVGRAEQCAWLADWFARGAATPRVAALYAVGGAGKTAVLERFVRTLPAALPAGVFVWSYYDDRRTEALLAQALAYVSPRAPAPDSEGAALERLLAALRRPDAPPHLLVLDGLEIAQSEGGDDRALGELTDPLLRRLLRALAAGVGRARVLLASRLPVADLAPWQPSGAVAAVPLGDLDAADARALLRAWGLRGDDHALARVLARVGRHALSVAMLGSYVGAFLDGDPARAAHVAPREAAGDDRLARRLAAVLAAYSAALGPRERDVLARLALCSNGAEPALLARFAASGGGIAGALTDADEGSLVRALARLARLGLVSRVPDAPDTPASPAGASRWTAHPFVREHFRAMLDEGTRARIHTAARDALAARLAAAPSRSGRDPRWLDEHEALLEHTVAAGDPAAAWEVYTRALGGFGHLGLVLGAMGRGLRVVRRFAGGVDDVRKLDARLAPDARLAAAYDWRLYAGALGDLPTAVRCYKEHARWIEANSADGALPVARATALQAMGLRTLAYTHWLAGALGAADEAVTRSLAIAVAHGQRFHHARALALRAAVRHDLGRTADAAADLAALHALDTGAPPARRALWAADIALDHGAHGDASALAQRCLDESAQRGWAGHVAHARVVLGDAARVRGALTEARAQLAESRAWVADSGEVEMALRWHLLAARVALAEGRAEEARGEAGAGLALAESGGFALFAARLASACSRAALAGGDTRAALASAREARALAAAGGYPWVLAEALAAAGAAHAAQRDAAAARADFTAARTLRAALENPRADGVSAMLAAQRAP